MHFVVLQFIITPSMGKNIFKKTLDILLRPFREHFLFFVIFGLLISCCHTYYELCILNERHTAIATVAHCLVITYVATWLVGLISNKTARRILQAVFIVLAATNFTLNYYCISQFYYLFDADIAQLVLATNPGEAKEFASTMIPFGTILSVVAVLLVLALFCWLAKRRKWNLNLGHKVSLLALVAMCLCIAVNVHWNAWKTGPLAPVIQLSDYDLPTDLKPYFSHPQLTLEENQNRPVNVVLIIGESFARNHSSLYGYDKMTNPKLGELKDSASLFCFDSINSPMFSTALSIKDMLSTFNLTDTTQDKKWYEFPSLIEIMKDCGYDSYWFGNQSCANTHNGTARTFAKTCDRQWFLQKEGVDIIEAHHYDDILVDSSLQYVKQGNQGKHNFFIYHMMGSHIDYSLRYPKEYAKFTTDDYSSEPENHRSILSTYDNSILFNDFVVRKIIDMFKDTESVVVYLPDHGQVMYRNPNMPDHFGHGVKSDPLNYALGIEIPFFVYASPLFQQHFPQTIERIKNRQANPKDWNSGDLPFFIMDLIGVKQINGEDVRPRSAL